MKGKLYKMTTIFVSYSRKNSDATHRIANNLRDEGYTVWTDVSGIIGGTVWHTEIEKAIINCDAVVIMLSFAAKNSEWVQKEMLFALENKKPIIPILLEKVTISLALINIQPINYFLDS